MKCVSISSDKHGAVGSGRWGAPVDPARMREREQARGGATTGGPRIASGRERKQEYCARGAGRETVRVLAAKRHDCN
jgi:hypothetical protein